MSIRDIDSVYSSHLAKYISEKGHEYNDAILVTKTKKKYPVYKVILAVRSDFFKRLFLSDEDHKIENEAGLEEFPLPTVSDEGLLPILHWLYHGEMEIGSLKTAQEVLETAEFLGVSSVSRGCQDWLLKNMDHDNVLGFIRYKTYKVEDL